jgi:cholesterol transport system auxiliary component
MKRAGILLAAAIVAGCALGAREADRYLILETPASATPAATRGDVRAMPTTAAAFYDTQSIAFSREPGMRAYYQFNHWTERPQRAIHVQLASRFSADEPHARLVLETHLDEIYHDAAVPPGTSRIVITATLVDAASRAAIARRTFVHSAPATSYDAPGAVRAFDVALSALLDDVMAWVDTEASKQP